jgi:hypothetical protein
LVRRFCASRAAESEFGAIVNTAEDLIGKCISALNDPQADKASLQALIAECSVGLRGLVAEQRLLRETMRAQLDEVAALLASQEAVWPEEVARLQALSEDVRRRAQLFAEG